MNKEKTTEVKQYIKFFIFIISILCLLALDVYAKQIDITKYININKCDKIIDKKIYSICYSYKNMGPLYTIYELDGNLVNKNNISERPRFYEEIEIPKNYRTESYQYTNTGYDRGHLSSDASFDYNSSDLNLVYSMANIIPQYPQVNAHKKLWSGLEIKERELAVKYKKIIIINKVNYPEPPYTTQYLKGTKIIIPISFEKHFIINNIKTCYKIYNRRYDIIPDNIEEFKVACQK